MRSPLLSLPSELRDMIYDYAIGGEEVRPKYSCSWNKISINLMSRPSGSDALYTGEAWKNLFILSHVCRQLRLETLCLPFTLSVFNIVGCNFGYFLIDLKVAFKESITTVSFGTDYINDLREAEENMVPDELDECINLKTVILKAGLYVWEKTLIKDWAEERDMKLVDEAEKGTSA
jgi:hypothetical protein